MPPVYSSSLLRIEDTLRAFQGAKRLTLHFPLETEIAYHNARLSERIAYYRSSFLGAILLYNAFLILDFFCLRQEFGLCVLVRVGINTPLALLFLLVIGHVRGWLRETIFAISYVPVTISLLVIYNVNREWIAGSQAALIIMMMYANIAMKPSFRSACVVVPALLLGDVVFLATNQWMDTSRIAMYTCLVGMAAILSLRARFVAERDDRIKYLHGLRYEAQNAELAKLTLIDPLTSIPNRRSFDAQFQEFWDLSVREHQPLAALMVDVDHFKEVNDRHGHGYGDKVLCLIASTLREVLRSEGDLMARYGGEEFVALLPHRTLESAVPIGERLRKAIAAIGFPPSLDEVEIHITVSVGVASMQPTFHGIPMELIRAADAALYEAKAAGRDCVRAGTPAHPNLGATVLDPPFMT